MLCTCRKLSGSLSKSPPHFPFLKAHSKSPCFPFSCFVLLLDKVTEKGLRGQKAPRKNRLPYSLKMGILNPPLIYKPIMVKFPPQTRLKPFGLNYKLSRNLSMSWLSSLEAFVSTWHPFQRQSVRVQSFFTIHIQSKPTSTNDPFCLPFF